MSASGFGPRKGRSTTTALTGSSLYATHKTLIFSTEFYFLPEGVKDVFARFKKALRENKLTAEPEWVHESYVFRVRCLRGETQYVPLLFITAMQSVIREEEELNGIYEVEEDDNDNGSETTFDDIFATTVADDRVQEGEPIKSTKIQRLDVWKANNTASHIAHVQTISPSPATQSTAHHSPALTAFPIQEEWFCGTKLHDVIPDITLQQLARLTGCRLVKDLSNGKVYIGGISEQSISLAIVKLDNMHKYSTEITPYTIHSFYTEETGDFKLSLNYITDVKTHKKRIFQTTLIDNLHTLEAFAHLRNTYLNLSKAITVRCAPFVKNDYTTVRIMKTSPVIEVPRQKLASEHWEIFKYNSKGKPSDNPLLQFEDDKPRPLKTLEEQLRPNDIQNIDMTRVEEWADRVPNMDLQPPEPVSSFFIPPAPLTNSPASQPAQPQPRTPSWDTSVPYNTEAKTMSGLEIASLKSKVSRHSHSNAARPTTIGSSASVSGSISTALPRSIVPPHRRTTATPPSSNPADEMLLNTPINASTLIDVDSPINFNTPPSPTAFDLSTDLIDLSDPNEPSSMQNSGPAASFRHGGTESLQLSNEVSTREFHNTMNQRKPKNANYKSGPPKPQLPLPSPPRVRQNAVHQTPRLVDPLPGFINDMNNNFQRLVSNKGLRGFRGRMTIRVELGRILIRNMNPKLISTKDSRETLDGEKVNDLLGPLPYAGHSQAIIHFTNKLTTVPEEIKHLVDTRSNGTRLWNTNPHWEVIYEFIYQEQSDSGSIFTIEMDAETFKAVLTEPRDLGSVYTHGVKRAWDFRITAFGGERTEITDQKYGEVVENLKSSLYVPGNLHEPKLTFELNETLAQKFKILSIRVHRMNKHMSPDGESYLKIDEVQDLCIRCRSALQKPVTVFDASPWTEDDLKSEAFHIPNWIEASIYSTKVDDLLLQNGKLELGDEAGWLPEHFAKADAAQTLYLPACEMLKHMDGIGYHNEHPKKVQEILMARSMLSETSSRHSNGPMSGRFW